MGLGFMALDIYVMPLWRYKVGDFRTPIEVATGIKPRVVTPDGIDERPSAVGWLGRWKARRQVASIRKSVEKWNRVPIRWHDEGTVVYCEQSRGMESLRAYALWLDHRDRFPVFERPPEGDYYKHPVWNIESDRPLSFPQLVGHDCYSGYFLPCDFERLTRVEPFLIFGRWPSSRSVGSGIRLRRELESLAGHLQVPEDYDYPDDDPLVSVKAAFIQLREVAEASCRHALPIIFWG
jgi:hypothetical protein